MRSSKSEVDVECKLSRRSEVGEEIRGVLNVPNGSGLCEGGAAVAFEKADDQYRVVICRRNSLQAKIRLKPGSILLVHEHLCVLTRTSGNEACRGHSNEARRDEEEVLSGRCFVIGVVK